MTPTDLSVRRFLLPPARKECVPFVLIALVLGSAVAAGLWFWRHSVPVAGYGALFGVALAYGVYLFFRDPERVPPEDPSLVVSPADGFVCLLQEAPLPKELAAGGEPVWRVSVFMSVLNVHVNRMPVAGKIVKTAYVPGAFINASLDKASEKNERSLYLVETPEGKRFGVVQIAGLVARRIVRFVKEGDSLTRGERFGLIRFGSRLDVYLPPGVKPAVRLGQQMVAGETPLAKLG